MTTTAGDRLKQEGQQLATNAADPRVIAAIDWWIAEFNRGGKPWSANDLRAVAPSGSQGLCGARVDAARKRGEMEAVGWVKSTLPSTRSKPVTVWRGVSK